MDHPSWRKSVARPLEVWPYQIRSWKQVRIVKKSFHFLFVLKMWKGKDLLTFLAFLDVFIQNFEIDILCIVSFNFCFILSDFCKNGCALKVVFCYACKRVQIPGDKFIKKTKELSLLCSCFSLYCFCFNVLKFQKYHQRNELHGFWRRSPQMHWTEICALGGQISPVFSPAQL